MAEVLQRKIEYADLKFISSFAMEKILDFQTYAIFDEFHSAYFSTVFEFRLFVK